MNIQTLLHSFWLQILSVMIRTTLTGWGVWLSVATDGAITGDMTSQVIGAIMIVLTFAWSLFEKFLISRFFKSPPTDL